jgi:tRNA dimethylallyltransferase
MHERLKAVDPQAAARIHPNDPQRIQRALEVYELTGRPLSQLQNRDGRQVLDYRVVKLVLSPADRAVLHRRIEARFLQMLDMGLEEEVRGLLETHRLTPDMPSMRLVGYRQMLEYLLGGSDRNTMIDRGIAATRQLAKRQLTWIRSEAGARRLDEGSGNIADQVLKILETNTIRCGN